MTEVCFAVGCSSLGTFSSRFTELVGMPPSTYRRHAAGATAGMPPCVAKQVTKPIRKRKKPVSRSAHLAFGRMDLTIATTFLPHDDHEGVPVLLPDTLGFEVRNDVAHGGMHWFTVGPTEQPGTLPSCGTRRRQPGVTDDERHTIAEMMAKGTLAALLLSHRRPSTARSPGSGPASPMVQEPTGRRQVRDCACADPRPDPDSSSAIGSRFFPDLKPVRIRGSHPSHN